MKRKSVLVFAFMIFSSMELLAASKGFDLKRLPRGKRVTLPNPAVTYVPLNDRVELTSTDMPQTVKLTAVNRKRGKAKSFRVVINDKNSSKKKYIMLRPGASYIYNFKDLGSISVVTELPIDSRGIANYSLKLESNKPLTIAR